jgi:hypothetical protein
MGLDTARAFSAASSFQSPARVLSEFRPAVWGLVCLVVTSISWRCCRTGARQQRARARPMDVDCHCWQHPPSRDASRRLRIRVPHCRARPGRAPELSYRLTVRFPSVASRLLSLTRCRRRRALAFTYCAGLIRTRTIQQGVAARVYKACALRGHVRRRRHR